MNPFWTTYYDALVSPTINPDEFPHIPALIESTVERFSNRPAFSSMGCVLTYGEMMDLALRMAAYLQCELKLQKGDRVAIMLPNVFQYPVALYGILEAGLVAVNMNPLYTSREIENHLVDSGARVLIIFENAAHKAAPILSKTSVEHVIVTGIGDLLGPLKSRIVNAMVKHVKRLVPDYDFSSSMSFQNALQIGKRHRFVRPLIQSHDLAILQYTGGTTGVSKGAMLSHRNIVANVIQIREWFKDGLKEGEEVLITALPMYHVFAFTANCLFFSTFGGLNVLILDPRDWKGFVAEMRRHPFTLFTGVNTLFNALLNRDDFRALDFSHLKYTVAGGMALQEAVARRWHEVTGTPINEGYGITENSAVASVNPRTMKEYTGYAGLPVPSTEFAIKDDAGLSLPIGELGEIAIKGPQVMSAYWNRSEETKAVFTDDGFLRTGDIGFMNEKGGIKIVDRKKDMILVSGFNVFPNEIEDVVIHIPGVAECCAIGVPDDKCGEVVKLFVVKSPLASLTELDIRSRCKSELTNYKCPRHIEFRDHLPKSNVGKILRKELRAEEIKCNSSK